jgi:hypothetical protein
MSKDNSGKPTLVKGNSRQTGENLVKNAPQRNQKENSAVDEKPVKPPKIPLPTIQYALLDWMADDNSLMGAGRFPNKFRTTELDRTKGIYALLEVDDANLATEVSNKTLEDALLKCMKSFNGDAFLYRLPIERLAKLAEKFVETKHGRQIPNPPLFTFESDKHIIAFNRVPDPAKGLIEFHGSESFAALAPKYSDFIDRNSEQLAVRQFFGALLHPEYHSKQSLHLWGDSNAGKSTFIELFLQALCGKRGYEPVDFDADDSFRFDGWSGKLALYADEMNDKYYSKPEYKRITNSTEQNVKIKHIRAHKQLIKAKLIATSNHCPSLPPDNAVTTRIVLSHVKELKEVITDRRHLQDCLAQEMPYILSDIEFAFSQLNNRPIKCSPDAHEEALSIYAAPLQELFDRYFVPAEKGFVTVSDFKKIVLKNLTRDITYQNMREFVHQKYGSDLNAKSNSERRVTKFRLKPGISP